MEQKDKKNQEGYADPTAYKVFISDERRHKAMYVFKTMISCARLAGFYVNDNLIIEDKEGRKYNSKEILRNNRNNKNV